MSEPESIESQGKPVRGKQRELLQRDAMFFEVARRIFLDEGIHELTVSRLADVTGFSRATLYDRFGSKEGLLVELGIACQRELLASMQRALLFPGHPRERLMAVSEAMAIYSERYSDNMRILATIGDESIAKRVSEVQQAQMRAIDADMFRVLLTITQDAVAKGDLVLPEGFRPESLCFLFWTMADGIAAAMRGSAPLEEFAITEPVKELLKCAQWFLDGWGWRPLATEWDYAATMRRAYEFLEQETQTEAIESSQPG
ncbi:MAG: TetR/AcrR family transcriptional regulator [Candidatus Hydrogenedentes bacterium]|nr:TetR/AcrR family transcriptional regulator [Candidatus Hydrogenedentota bacterium]